MGAVSLGEGIRTYALLPVPGSGRGAKAGPHNSLVDGKRRAGQQPLGAAPCDQAQPIRNHRRPSALDTARRRPYSPAKPNPRPALSLRHDRTSTRRG
jgi:hypothetical protein